MWYFHLFSWKSIFQSKTSQRLHSCLGHNEFLTLFLALSLLLDKRADRTNKTNVRHCCSAPLCTTGKDCAEGITDSRSGSFLVHTKILRCSSDHSYQCWLSNASIFKCWSSFPFFNFLFFLLWLMFYSLLRVACFSSLCQNPCFPHFVVYTHSSTMK